MTPKEERRRLGVPGRPTASRRLVVLLVSLWVGLVVVDATLHLAKQQVVDALLAGVLVVFAGVGGLLATRRPANPIGWLLLAVALLFAGSEVAKGIYLEEQGALKSGLIARGLVWFDNWALQVWVGLIGVMVPLLFPDGRLPSRRWRIFGGVSVATIAAAAVGTAFGGATLDWESEGTVANPLRIGGIVGQALEAMSAVAVPGIAVVHLGALLAVILRLRRSEGVERLQMKWFASAMGLLLVGLLGAVVGSNTGLDAPAFAGWILFLLSLAFALPIAIGVAILRHRLYDIDVVINRALVYGALTAALAGAYLGAVLLVGLAVGESDVAIAVSTLAVAALFRPLRARIQALVDRRFYRRRYDAVRTLEAFGGRLRDELDLEALGADLRGVVRETVQPAHVSLWLRTAERR